jgi:deoxyribodipyrimidine photolyase
LVLLARLGLRAAEVARADGDVTCNAGNWQWVAGTSHNTRLTGS